MHSSIDGSITSKLDIARQELASHLRSISYQLHTDHQIEFTFPSSEIDVLHAAPSSHVCASTTVNNIDDEVNGCKFDEGEGYRCKCTFQIVSRSSLAIDEQTSSASTIDCDKDLIYVTREDGRICSLPSGIFPPANRRIRRAMVDLMNCLNSKLNDMNADGGESTLYAFARLRNNLTSATFVTSWADGPIQQQSVSGNDGGCNSCNGGDCLVTLHYGPPGLQPANKDDGCNYGELQEWKKEAKTICDQCRFTLLTGRAKGVKVSVTGQRSDAMIDRDVDDKAISEEGIIHDDLWLLLRDVPIESNAPKIVEVDRVALVSPAALQSTTNEDEPSSAVHNKHVHEVCIHYQKPATAFQHPNAGVMLTSLHWILSVLSKIAKQRATITADATITETKPRLLEMYCGCGAHTLPLAKSTLLSKIVAVELDERLVDACRNNCRLNNCLKDDNSSSDQSNNDRTLVEVFKGDATEWADKTLRRQRKQQKSDGYNNFDILLVDPPRDGLSSTVCDMALNGTFAHLIYVSCGRRALLRDLTLLCGSNEEGVAGFDVVDLAVIDLFPGTDAVESLVHLQRRRE